MALTTLLCVSILIQWLQFLFTVLHTPANKKQTEPERESPLPLIEAARKLGVTKLEFGDLKVEISPPAIPFETPKTLTPAEQKQADEDLLLHSVRS